MSDLALTLARHPRFEWRPGMLWIVRRTAPLEDYSGRVERRGQVVLASAPRSICHSRPPVPDLTDAATAGVLLAILADTGELAAVCPVSGGWGVRCGSYHQHYGATLGEALARALLAVWGPA